MGRLWPHPNTTALIVRSGRARNRQIGALFEVPLSISVPFECALTWISEGGNLYTPTYEKPVAPDDPVADTNSGVWTTALEAGRRGLRESLTDTAQSLDPFTDRAAEAYDPNDHVSKLLAQPVSQGSPALAALDCSTATPYRLRTVF
jgi:hypothetical protein